MKINKVVAIDFQNGNKQTFTFATAQQRKAVITAKGGKLNNYLEFCFKEEVDCVKDVEVEFCINDDLFSLARIHNDDGTTRSVLKKMTDGHWQVVARSKAVKYIEELIDEQLADMLTIDYVNNKSVANFHGNLMAFAQVRMLSEVQQSVTQATLSAQAMKEDALRKVKQYNAVDLSLSVAEMDKIDVQLQTVSRDLAMATSQLGELKAKQSVSALRQGIASDLERAQQQYDKLTSRQEEVEDARARIRLRDDVEMLIPKVRALRQIAEQRAEYEKKRYAITTELDWLENELVGINAQLEEKQRQYAVTQDKRNRIDAINQELSYIASLYEKNKDLNAQLLELNDQQQRLSAEKVLYTNKLDLVEKSIGEAKESLDAFQIPAKSVGELLETVRVDVKIDEVSAQLEKLQSELAVKESQIAEKESNLVVQVKRFRSVAELDVAVTPIKAKDTILQVLDTKCSKLESINVSLQEKSRNLQRALEDYKYKLVQLEQSRAKIEQKRDQLLLRKQEEFKREVYLNSQKVYSDDVSGVFAVSASFHDQEMDVLDEEINARNMDRDLLLQRVYQLEGSLKEIARHTEINNAEIDGLQREKANINKRYNEIISQNSNEAVLNYLKALNSDNGTKYLLDVQQDAVRGEAELGEFKRGAESMRLKIANLKNRLKYLRDTQRQLDTNRSSVDTLISTNDKLKDELTDIGDRLSAGYEQYKAVVRQLESVDSKLDDVRSAIIEASKTIKVNEQQIEQSTLRAQKHAGSDDIEQAVADFKYELGDVESERQMLVESKQTTEKEVFKKRLELEKTQWLFDSKRSEYDELFQELQFEFGLKGLDVDKVSSVDIDSDLNDMRKVVSEYDVMRGNLAERIKNLYAILQNQKIEVVTDTQIAQKQLVVDELQAKQTNLEQLRSAHLENFVVATNSRVKATAAAAEVRAINNLRTTIAHNDLVGVLISDKIKSILALATQYLSVFVRDSYCIEQEDYVVYVLHNGQKQLYDQLPDEVKTALYVSLILAMPNTDTSAGKWLIFEERIAIDKQLLGNMLLGIDNVSFVVDYSKEAVKAKEQQGEQTE